MAAVQAWVPAAYVDGNPSVVVPMLDVGKGWNSVLEFARPVNPVSPFGGTLRASYKLDNRVVPSGTLLVFDAWMYRDPVTALCSRPDARWYRLSQMPMWLNNALSLMSGMQMPFAGTRSQSQPFACYYAVMNGFHSGEDWAGVFGVTAVASGLVVRSANLGEYNGKTRGNCIVVQHSVVDTGGRKLYSHYLHLNQTLPKNACVLKGQALGSTIDEQRHLHWDMRVTATPLGAERLYPNDGQGNGYYTSRAKLRTDGYVCGSKLVKEGRIASEHSGRDKCTCDAIPANRQA